MIEANSSANYIYETSKVFNSSITYPNNPFANQLKTTAKFINSHLDSKVYYVSMGGFDTHAYQIKRKSAFLNFTVNL